MSYYDDVTSETGLSLKITDYIERRMLIKGYKLDLFSLQLSFILWNILGILTMRVPSCGDPYQNISLAIL